MASTKDSIAEVDVTTLKPGVEFDLGSLVLSEEEIIRFASEYDPLPFHLDSKKAKDSIFGNLIASGPQVFIYIHRREWVPRFGHSVIAGLEIKSWKFLKPTYANSLVTAKVVIKDVEKSENHQSSIITWAYEFKNEAQEILCTLSMRIIHQVA